MHWRIAERKVLKVNVDLTQLVSVSRTLGDSNEDSESLFAMAGEAKGFIQSFEWCIGVNRQYFGLGVGGVLAVFLCDITPASPDVDKWLWVVVGDIPPAYIVTDDAPTATFALNAYIRELRKWIDAAKSGKNVDDLIPVNAPATPEWASELERRLAFIEETSSGWLLVVVCIAIPYPIWPGRCGSR